MTDKNDHPGGEAADCKSDKLGGRKRKAADSENDNHSKRHKVAPPAVPETFGIRKVEGKIGSGTFGTVFKVTDENGKPLAVKMSNNEPYSRIITEAELTVLNMFDSKYIVRSIGCHRDEKQVAIAMECADTNLFAYVSTRRLVGEQLRTAIHQVLYGVYTCHNAGVIHRDIKPNNILVTFDPGLLKLADFGSAKFPGKKFDTGGPYGHHDFRAPELLIQALNGDSVVPFKNEQVPENAVDMWSVGCVIAFMVNSACLFNAKTEREVIDQIFKLCGTPTEWLATVTKLKFEDRQPATLSDYIRTQDEGLLDLIASCLTVQPNERITAKEALLHPYILGHEQH